MNIQLEARHISIPFRFTYGHSKASHQGVELILCCATDSEGRRGYGEAVPRHYVTGETCDSVMKDLEVCIALLKEKASDEVALRRALIEIATGWNGPFPSCAFSAIELALLDLFSHQKQKPFHALLGAQQTTSLRYSASIGLGSSAFVKMQLLAYRALGLNSFKLKVGGPHDFDALKLVHRVLGRDVRLFVDANGAWDRETAARNMDRFQAAGVWGVEEPLRRRVATKIKGQFDGEETLDEMHYQNNAWLKQRSPISLIADESVISLRSMQNIIKYDAFDAVDIRISKLGGAFLSSHIIELAKANGMQFYIGAMVGETPVLATAGAHLGSVHADHLCIQGHSHRALHRTQSFSGAPALKANGKLKLTDQVGLGVWAHRGRLERLTLNKREWTL